MGELHIKSNVIKIGYHNYTKKANLLWLFICHKANITKEFTTRTSEVRFKKHLSPFLVTLDKKGEKVKNSNFFLCHLLYIHTKLRHFQQQEPWECEWKAGFDICKYSNFNYNTDLLYLKNK
jgi:hypothetical protein